MPQRPAPSPPRKHNPWTRRFRSQQLQPIEDEKPNELQETVEVEVDV